jgi:hypothetical protein
MRLTRRERDIVVALLDALAAPEPPLPPVARTDAVEAFGAWLEASPRLNRLGLRGALRVLDVAAVRGRRDRGARTAALRRFGRTRGGGALLRMLSAVLLITYYGDPGVMRLLGYDADANVARGARLVAQEGRVA